MIENIRIFEGFIKDIRFIVTENEYKSFQVCSKDMNPLHLNDDYARTHGFDNRVMYGNILNAFISYTVGMELPTQNVVLLAQSIQYKNPVYLNDVLNMRLKVKGISEAARSVTFNFKFCNSEGKIVAKGDIIIGVLE